MDALALLCTLYGDGPRTRTRLRSAGWDSIEVIVGLDLELLARELKTSVAGAARFQREAKQLAERLGIALDEEERSMLSSADEVDPGPPSAPASHASALPAPDPLRRVLERWRELDAGAPASADAAPPPKPSTTVGAWSSGDSSMSAASDWIPRPRAAPGASVPRGAGPNSLCVGAFDGCTPEVVAALEEASVRTLRELVDAEPLLLAERVRRPVLDCMRWQFLAKRALRELRLSPANAPLPRLLRDLPPPEGSEGVGGPFA